MNTQGRPYKICSWLGVAVFILKTESSQDANFVITVGTGDCHHNHLRCQEWWHIWHHDDSCIQSSPSYPIPSIINESQWCFISILQDYFTATRWIMRWLQWQSCNPDVYGLKRLVPQHTKTQRNVNSAHDWCDMYSISYSTIKSLQTPCKETL